MKHPKATPEQIQAFIGLQTVALIGVSQDPKRFGASSYTELRKRGWKLIPVNPKYDSVQGETCYPDLKSLPVRVDGIISMVSKANTVNVLNEAYELGVSKIWVQQMSETPEAIAFAQDHGMDVIFGKCILMYYPPVTSIHGFHRWLVKLFSGNKIP
ncbi:MAG: CoA-binding protein [Bacteroidales bacterium]